MSDFISSFKEIPEPRIQRCRRHELLDILFLSISAILCSTSLGKSTRTSRSVIGVMGKPFSLQVRIDVLFGVNVTTASFLLLLMNAFTIKFWFVFSRTQKA